MIHQLRRIGFPPFKRSRGRSRRSLAQLTHRLHVSEPLEPRMLLATDVLSAWQNPVNAADVDNSGHVVSLDALAVLNALSRGGDALLAYAGGRSLAAKPAVPASPDAPFMDVNGDRSVTTEDAEGVLSTLNQAAEGESGDVSIEVGDGVFVIYNSTTGELRVDSDLFITTLEIVSASSIFTGSAALNLGGTFDIDSDTKIFKMLPQGFRDLTFGTVAKTGLSEAAVRRDLTIAGSHLKPQGWPQDRPATLSNKQVKMRLQITDLNSNPITQINHGQDFYLRATVQDVRAASLVSEDSEGVFAAYLDVQYNSALAKAAGTIQYAAAYTNAKAGTVSAGLLDEVGATSTSLSALDTTERELFRIRMTATGGGSLTFDADAADVAPQHDTLMFGGTAAVDDLDIQYIDSQTVTVVDTPTEEDLVAFAKAIAATGAKFYGAFWCSACHAQQDLFEDGGNFLPYVESSKPDRTQTPEAIAAGITSYPTWVFADNSRLVGAQTLETLSQKTGVAIPQSNKPFINPIDNKTLLAGAPLHVAIDGYDPNGGPLTYTITSSNQSLVSAIKPQNNRSMRIVVESYGEMVFQLFEDLAPRPAGRVIELAQDGFYDGLTFHRIVNNFMIQGGDPNGNGTGGSDLPDFDDQFHVDLQHTGTGLLSFAKSSDDTNNSQFFITEGSSRHLDFNHSIFGQLIEGEKVRDNISNTEVVAQTSGEVSKPKITVFMDTVEIFSDTENSLVRLKAAAGQTGTATITVTARDQDGHEFVETFDVTVSPDTVNGGPFLNDIPAITTKVDTPVNFQLSAQDVEGDSFTFSGVNGSNLTLNVNATTGQVTATPKAGFIGTATATVGVRATGATSAFDNQLITVQVLPNTPVVTLLPGSDSGISNSDRLTNLTNLQFQVSNVVSGAVVSLYADGSKIGEGTADGTTITITTANLSALGDGEYDVTAKQTVSGQTSEASTVLLVMLDQTAPGNFTSTPPTTGIAGQAIAYDANHPEEGQSGFRYSLSSGPTGATVNATTGQLNWTPTNVQVGAQTFGIVATDAAGNSKTQTVNLTIDQQELMRFRLKVVDADGDPIQAVAVGQNFTLQVLVQDVRDEALGVFAAYVDATYDTARVQLNGSITFGSSFPNVRLGSTTTAGLIDEAGATAGTDPLGSGEFLLMSVSFVAQTVGQAVFGANPADDLPIHDTLLRGLNVPLTADQMLYEGTTLQIVGATSAQNDEMQVPEDSDPVRMFVLDNDIVIPPTATVTITNVGTPAHGTAQIVTTDQGQAIEYKPAANYVGQDTFSYTIQDSAGGTSTATVTVTVTNVNDPPTALDDTFTVAEDAAATDLNVLVNDNMAPDTGETLKITNVTSAAHGTVTIANNGAVLRYTPAANYSGSDTFTYTLSDGNGGTDQATVTVTVTEVNDAPVVGADTRTVNEDTALVLNVSDLLANDNAGPSETGQTLTVTGVNGASTGTVSLQGSTITFTPAANYSGTATFSYTVRDNGTTNGNADPKSTTGTVTVTVSAVNDPPTAVNDTATAQTGGSAIIINVLANDLITPDQGETLSVTSVGAATQGTARRTESGQVEYTPSATFVGTDSFTYTISDGNGGTSTGTVTVTLQNFVPGGLSGSVFYDLSNDGVWQTGEIGLSGLKVALTGTNAQGQAVNLTSTTGKDGSYKFDQLTSGSYTLTQQQPVFTVDGMDHATVNGVQSPAKNSLTVQLAADGLGTGKLNFAEQRLDPKFALWEALASSSSTGLYAAVDSTEGRLWSRQDTGWENTDIVDIEFSADKSSLTITILEGTQTKAATVARSDHSKVQVIGREGQANLVRFNGAKTAYNFQTVAATAAEGESARDQIFAQGSW